MCFYYLFRYKKMNELERNPKKYIEKLFHFLEDKGFQEFYYQVNGEESLTYKKDGFSINIDYNCYLKMQYVYINLNKTETSKLEEKLCITDEFYKLRFKDYETLNCMEKLNLVAEYLSKNIECVIHANTVNV